MDFGFNEQQESMRGAARKLLETECPTSLVRKLAEDELGFPAELWSKLARLGWLGILIPGRLGGLGGTLVDATPILEEMGRALFPGPFLATSVLAATAIAEGGSPTQKNALLPAIADGSALATVAFLEDPMDAGPAELNLPARRKRGGWILSGEKHFVLDAGGADWIVVAARTSRSRRIPEKGVTLFVLDARSPGVTIVPLRHVDGTRRLATVALDRVFAPAGAALGSVDRGWPILARTIEVGTVAIAVDTVGLAGRALEMAVEHARSRVQFGRPIGAFQAVKHKCVDMMVAVESTRSLAYWAAWAVAGRDEARARAVPMAKAHASETGKNVTGEALQVHGGISFTWEHDAHLYYRRALANEALFGAAPFHRETVARRLNL